MSKTKAGELGRQPGATVVALYRWGRKYGGLQVNDARRLKGLDEENRQLKRPGGGSGAQLQVVKDLLGRRVVRPERRRTAVTLICSA